LRAKFRWRGRPWLAKQRLQSQLASFTCFLEVSGKNEPIPGRVATMTWIDERAHQLPARGNELLLNG
jgi:hypothetical protein